MLQQSLQSLQECLQILSLQAASTFPGQLHAAVSSTRADMERLQAKPGAGKSQDGGQSRRQSGEAKPTRSQEEINAANRARPIRKHNIA